MLGASQEWEAGDSPWSHPMQSTQILTVVIPDGGGGGGDDDGDATFHSLTAFLNPGCMFKSPQVFLKFTSEPHPKAVILEL